MVRSRGMPHVRAALAVFRVAVLGGKHRILLLAGSIALALFAATFPAGAAGEQTVGLFLNEAGSFDGYTLFAPISYDTTYLIDNDGRLIHSWDVGWEPGTFGFAPYLLEDGSVIRTTGFGGIAGLGGTGQVERVAWDGTLVWEFEYSSPDHDLHHDIEVLPNGNVLMIAWEHRTGAEAIAAGRDPALLSDGGLLPEHIIEVEPTPPVGGNIVWEWHAWDHLIQDYDATKDNYGVVADHPELIDINFGQPLSFNPPDWLHANGIDYNPEFDQIVVSLRQFSEFWVIDHSTTTAEASGHTGGNSGRGGDILYRWGNPQAYGAGDAGDQKLFVQHDAQWIEPGLPGEGNFLVFNNGTGRPGGDSSSVDEIVPPVDGFGNYSLTPSQAYGPQEQIWIHALEADLYSAFISGAVRLPNGNTLIDSGGNGTFVEVTPEGQIVWRYVNPVTSTGPLTQGDSPGGNGVFRAYRYAPDYPGLQGKDLTPGLTIELVDSDKDGLSDQEEVNIYGTDPLLADTDGDGCTDGAEVGPNEGTGGLRNPLNFWDFYDVPAGEALERNRSVNIADIFALVQRFGQNDEAGTAPINRNTDPLSTPPLPGLTSPESYHPAYDRGGPISGQNPWNVLPANGQVNIQDIFLAMVQFGHDCSGQP